jgi:hypothetical protein
LSIRCEQAVRVTLAWEEGQEARVLQENINTCSAQLGEWRQPEAIQRLKNCAQIVPKICQKYQNVSKDIELHRNPEALKNEPFAE